MTTDVTRMLLPIGSVVLLKGGNVPLMVFGRMQVAAADGRVWDYAAVPYPEGNLGADKSVMFDRDQVEALLFIGYQTQQEVLLRAWLEKAAVSEGAGPWPPDAPEEAPARLADSQEGA